MTLLKKNLILISFVLFLIFCGIYGKNLLYAQINGEGLTISPPISEPQIKPGQSVEQIIRLTNPTDRLIEVYPRVMDFKAKGETGEPKFIEPSTEDSKYSLASWITFQKSKVALTPEQIVEFKYTITVPTDAEPGGHYGVVFFASEPPKSEENVSNVTISSMVGSLILVKVPGQIVEKGVVDQFSAEKTLYLNGDVNLAARISNVGNVHFKPQGKVKINGWFGTTKELPINEQNGNILPDSTRKFENKWTPDKIAFGRYRADISIVYGESEKTLTAFTTFWIIPWWSFVILAAIILILIFLIVRLRRRLRTKKNLAKELESSNKNVILR